MNMHFLNDKMVGKYVTDWSILLNNDASRRGNGGNKLRTCRLFKTEFNVEKYYIMLFSLKHRSAFAKFRCGVAPIKIKTCQYENLAVEECVCLFCNRFENEMHVRLECNAYNDVRLILLNKTADIRPEFSFLSTIDKFKFLFSEHRLTKTCFNIWQNRNSLLLR